MKRALLVAACVMASIMPVSAELALLPKPVSIVENQSAGYTLTADTRIKCDKDFLPTIKLAVCQLNAATGFAWEVKASGLLSGSAEIVFEKVEGLAEEGYTLESCEKGVLIKASTAKGAFYGYQTLRQLLPVEIYSKEVVQGVTWSVPSVSIKDTPRFPWRGIMIDEGRYFMGRSAVLDMLDSMAMHKLNVMHWHLTEDQGWRIEIKKYPQLVLNGAKRAESPVYTSKNREGDGTPYGYYYYTQDQIKEIVAYAEARHITIVPEIEMPGHAVSALSAFPDLSCTGGPFTPTCRWGVQADIYCAGNDHTIRFLEDVLDEVMELFPSSYIHIGGDEAPKRRWNQCAKCQKRIKDNGLKDSHELQSWFISHFSNYLRDHGRNLIGWGEILEGGLAEGAAVMSWIGVKSGIQAAEMGHKVVMTPIGACYLDYGQNIPDDPYCYMGGGVTLRSSYNFDPCNGVPEKFHSYVMGLQGNLWSEYIRDQAELEWKAWPRACALAEVAWSPATKDWKNFNSRIYKHITRLDVNGTNHAPLPMKPVAGWESGDVPVTWTEKTWDVTSAIKGAGTYEVTFTYTGGSSRLDMKTVSLEADGAFAKVVDAHQGYTGSKQKDNVFTVKIPDNKGKKVILRATVFCDGNTNSSGDITITRK